MKNFFLIKTFWQDNWIALVLKINAFDSFDGSISPVNHKSKMLKKLIQAY